MSEDRIYPVPEAFAASSHCTNDQYLEMYQRSTDDNEGFWREQGQRIDWIKPYTKISDVNWNMPGVSAKWYEDGTLNASYNCIDRHLATKGDKPALIWEPDDPNAEGMTITFKELHGHVCRLANAMNSLGVKKGDVVTIYMPMVPEAIYAMQACSRIGAIHSVVFGGFSPDALSVRINDCDSKCLITADEGMRGKKPIPLKANSDAACDLAPGVENVIVIKATGGDINWVEGRDVWYHDIVADASDDCEPEEMASEDPLFILYTSGSTGTPKGAMHGTGGYCVFTSLTFEYIFDHKDDDIFWCTADIGWITGHSYVNYGPMLNGATQVIFEGVPNYPDASRFWQVCDKHKVSVFYTAPTALRALMGAGNEFVTKTDRSSIRLLGTVGEPINPEAWNWYHEVVGDSRCPIVDTWWQTETGGIMITPLPGATALKPGSATRPFFGVKPELLDTEGNVIEGEGEGALVLSMSWPSQIRTVYKNHDRFEDTYFSAFPGKYFTSDGCKRDADGYYWITGRVDDVLNVSGHRMGTAEVESALVAHPSVAEAAVVGYPHDIKGQGIYCYITLNAGTEGTDDLKKDMVTQVRKEIGPVASPDLIQWAPGLPKTRSGKIMRRILRKIAENDYSNLGDTSTLAEPAVVDDLIENRQNR
ncbi:MAG: acetate--CoA ligase [Rhodospirillaceae bacterium]|nr:acetate--CoA ligase [Rhodospirillaceae bacterium]